MVTTRPTAITPMGRRRLTVSALIAAGQYGQRENVRYALQDNFDPQAITMIFLIIDQYHGDYHHGLFTQSLPDSFLDDQTIGALLDALLRRFTVSALIAAGQYGHRETVRYLLQAYEIDPQPIARMFFIID